MNRGISQARWPREHWVGLAAVALVLAGPPGSSLAASLRLPDARLLHPEQALILQLTRLPEGPVPADIGGGLTPPRTP